MTDLSTLCHPFQRLALSSGNADKPNSIFYEPGNLYKILKTFTEKINLQSDQSTNSPNSSASPTEYALSIQQVEQWRYYISGCRCL